MRVHLVCFLETHDQMNLSKSVPFRSHRLVKHGVFLVNYPPLVEGMILRGVSCSLLACDSTSPPRMEEQARVGRLTAALEVRFHAYRFAPGCSRDPQEKFLFRAFVAQTGSSGNLIRQKGCACGVNVYDDPLRVDSSPDEKRGTPRPTILNFVDRISKKRNHKCIPIR